MRRLCSTVSETVYDQVGSNLLAQINKNQHSQLDKHGKQTCADEATPRNIWFRGLFMAYVMINMSAKTGYSAADSIRMAASDKYCFAWPAERDAATIRRYIRSRIVIRMVIMMLTLRETI